MTNINSFSDLEFVKVPGFLIPSEIEINTLIGTNDFGDALITSSFKNLLIRISNEILVGVPYTSSIIKSQASRMFNRIGFYYNSNSVLKFIVNDNALDVATDIIINDLNDLTTFQKVAYNAFHNNSWAHEANNIRGNKLTNLQKLHQISLNVNNILFNTRDENTGRFLEIIPEQTEGFLGARYDQNGDLIPGPLLPYNIVVSNNTTESIRLRIKVEYTKTRNSNGTGTIYRKFLNYFPDESTPFNITTDTRIVQSNGSTDNSGNPTDRIFVDELIDKIRGGKVTIQYVVGNDTWVENNIHSFVFHIRAQNPTRDQVVNYLQEARGTNGTDPSYLERYWFLIKLIRHESGTHGSNEFLHFNPRGAGYSHNNNVSGFPNFGGPRGFGLGQIDNFGDLRDLNATQIANLGLTTGLAEIQPGEAKAYQTTIDNQGRTVDHERYIVASDDEVWNWKKNIDAIIRVIESKISILLSDIAYTNNSGQNIILEYGIPSIRTFVQAWNITYPTNRVVIPANQTEGQITYSAIRSNITEFANYNDLFPATPVSTATLKSFFDAMLLKTYNGIGSGATHRAHYIKLTPIPQNTTIPLLSVRNVVEYTLNGQTRYNYYVRDVSNEND